MPRIAVLSSTVIDQIAAGEVVERPASVVKELVENALDAGATTIEIAVDEGGRTRIRVADDGCGMERGDALLALQRHATSKIRGTEDIVGVGSFGFRGEALPAIASVAELELETAPEDGAGTRVRSIGGAVDRVDEAARRRGTTVTVSRLFFNAPAREKFLRSSRAEARGISEIVTTLALSRRDVRLTVTRDGETALQLPPAGTMRARVASLWGASFAERLVEVDDVSGPMHVSGLVERPGDVGTAGRRFYLSVNGRAIRDAGIIRAAEAAYRTAIPSGMRPSVLLELVVPADIVDVNVHPTKAEVRFRERWSIERAVEHAVRRALGLPSAAAGFGQRQWPVAPEGGAMPVDVEAMLTPIGSSALGAFDGEAEHEADRASPQPIVPPLTQLRRTYLLCELDDGVLLIDQHSAHERVLYEKFMTALERGDAPSQRLLFPITLHLGPAEGEAFEQHREFFTKLGFEIEEFGGHTLLLHAVPMPHPRFDAERCLRDSLSALTGDRGAAGLARHERLAATVACKAAIKAGDELAPAEMRALYAALAATTLPAHDVHGRSTIVRLPWDELERRFGRR